MTFSRCSVRFPYGVLMCLEVVLLFVVLQVSFRPLSGFLKVS